MSIFDKILGKKEEAKKPQPETGQPLAEEKKAEKVKVEKKFEKPQPETGQTLAEKKEVKSRKIAKKEENIAHKILLENLISEKSTMLAEHNKFVFKVKKDAGKFQIKEAVEGYFGVQVVSVNTIKISPKKRIHGRTIGWKKGFKKAVVTLREGDTIAAVEGV